MCFAFRTLNFQKVFECVGFLADQATTHWSAPHFYGFAVSREFSETVSDRDEESGKDKVEPDGDYGR